MAITFVNGQTTNSSADGSGNGTWNSGGAMSLSPGHLLIAYLWNQGGPGQTPSATDTVNSGSWTLVNSASTDGARWVGVLAKVCNGIGTLANISYTNTAPSGNNSVSIVHFSGFAGTPSYAGDFSYNAHTGSSSTAVSGTSFNTSQANELVLAFSTMLNTQAWSAAPGAPWITPTMGGNGQATDRYTNYQLVTSASTAVQLTGTLAVADFWMVTQIGFYDFIAPPVIPSSYPLESAEYY